MVAKRLQNRVAALNMSIFDENLKNKYFCEFLMILRYFYGWSPDTSGNASRAGSQKSMKMMKNHEFLMNF